MLHFTYCNPDGEDLQQGDVLCKTEDISSLIRQVHPHYLKDDYSHFLVLTQSCDLVRRPNCKARYITLAAVRPIEIVLQREVEKFQDRISKAAGACKQSARGNVKRFLQRLLNNNEGEFFYLQKEPSVGLSDNSCAFLRLSISIRAYEHYQKCMDARSISLKPTVQNKLGWLTGNMYSRVGTEDWTPENVSEDQFKEIIDEILDLNFVWIEDEVLRLWRAYQGGRQRHRRSCS
jgi:hypothetical protein